MKENVRRLSSDDTLEILKCYLSKYDQSIVIKNNAGYENLFLYDYNNNVGSKCSIGIAANSSCLPRVFNSGENIFVGFDNNVFILDNNLSFKSKKSSISPFYDFVLYLDDNIVILVFELDVIGMSICSGEQLWEVAINDVITCYKKLFKNLEIETLEGEKININIFNGVKESD